MKIKNPLVKKIDKALESKKEHPRQHMGASLLGHECDRYLWLKFRWAVDENFSGRLLRIFRRGHLEEPLVIADLQAAGVDVVEYGDDQVFLDFGSHVGGSRDGLILSGVPEAPNKKHVLEIKTHNEKSFKEAQNNGVKKSHFKHWVQMQCYMYGSGVDRALYYAVNKNDDRIYLERVKLDTEAAEKFLKRGKEIATADKMPEPIKGAGVGWYVCRMCNMYDFCHKTKLTKEINCRTCAHSTARTDGMWECEKWETIIPPEELYNGCGAHCFHPDLVPWQFVEAASTESSAAYIIGGKTVLNGEDGIKSKDILQLDSVVNVFEGELQ